VSMMNPSQGSPPYRRANRRRGDHRGQEVENSERWLLTYSDMITLLLVLFIVLFAISTINRAKFRELKQSVTHAVLQRTPHGTTKVNDKTKLTETPQARFKQIEKELSAALKAEGLLRDVTLKINSTGLVEGLVADSTFFTTNSANLTSVGARIVDTSAGVLRHYPNAIEVAGYTDNEPIAGGPYANNWALSAARATTVVVRMTQTDGVNPAQAVALGYGQYHPQSSNSSSTGRAQNRRVNIVISPTATFKP
jgi:chemotaxis protein MotB